MAEVAPAAPAKAPAKSPKKKSASKPKKDALPLTKLIVAAVTESKERKGTSLAAIKKVLATKGIDVPKANKRINTAVTKLVTKGTLSQTKGTGASGSFKLTKTEPKPKKAVKKAPAKAKKPAAKKTSPKKKVPVKKSAAKKSPKKAAAKKAPAKKAVKKPAAKKSPKKAAKKVVKKAPAKKAPAKKAAPKKAKK